MTVLCGACTAENRDAAKFCKGCGRKIAQAWPQATPVATGAGDAALLLGASALAPRATAKRAETEKELTPMPAPPRARISNGRWIVGLGLGVVLLVLAAAWWGHRNKSQEIAEPAAAAVDAAANPTPAAEINAPASSSATPASPSPFAPLELADKPQAAPVAEAAAPASSKPRKSEAKKQAPPPAAPAVEAAAAASPQPAPEPVRMPTPQESCAGRNFIARAQCMAEQCTRPEVARHPQCEGVRQQQRIEEEKRNPTMAG